MDFIDEAGAADSYYQTMEESLDSTMLELVENCVWPTLVQVYGYVEALVLYSLFFRLLGYVAHRYDNPKLSHIASLICGNLTLVHIIGEPALYCILFVYVKYVLLVVFCYVFHAKRIGHIIGGICLVALTVCEFWKPNHDVWRQIRGIEMIQTMKVVSLAFDLYTNSKADKVRAPEPLPFLGYMFCPANILMGPWISYEKYLSINFSFNWEFQWLYWTLINIIFAVVSVACSNCFVPAMISDNSWKWWVAFRIALAFRFSHYFVSYLSQATMAITGIASNKDENHSSLVGMEVVRPWCIELPRSLTEVVVNWNIPMHNWLKTYVFKTVRPHSPALAIFITYFVSSILHGMNLQLSAILLSLGWYTYIEYNLRFKLSEYLRGCIMTRPCDPDCGHELQSYSPLIFAGNCAFTIIAMVHLAYLGAMFDSAASVREEGYSLRNVFDIWRNLDYCSHWIAIGSHFIYLLLI